MTTKPNDGGPAFPQLYEMGSITVSQNGMSLRDYAMVHLMAAVMGTAQNIGSMNERERRQMWDRASVYVHEAIDAMLKAREVPDDQA